MKRIQCACLEQTILLETQQDYSAYRATLEKKRVKHRIVDEQRRSDGSIVVRIKKQYNHYDTGDYLD